MQVNLKGILFSTLFFIGGITAGWFVVIILQGIISASIEFGVIAIGLVLLQEFLASLGFQVQFEGFISLIKWLFLSESLAVAATAFIGSEAALHGYLKGKKQDGEEKESIIPTTHIVLLVVAALVGFLLNNYYF